jgi:hypothetical protein
MTRTGSPGRFRPVQGMVLTLWPRSPAGRLTTTRVAGSTPKLLLVGLDDGGVSRCRSVVVEPGLTQRAPLPQEVPALVERHLELLEASTIGVVGRPGSLARPELVLLLDECLDGPVYLLIVHASMLDAAGYPPAMRRIRRCSSRSSVRSRWSVVGQFSASASVIAS